MTLQGLRFAWDSNKAQAIFADPDEVMLPDPDHSANEERYISIGRASNGEIMLACYTESDDVIRLISAGKPFRPKFGCTCVREIEMRESYDVSKGRRGIHAGRYAEGVTVVIDGKTTVVSLEPDVSAVFPDAASVNEALRVLIKAARSAQELQRAS